MDFKFIALNDITNYCSHPSNEEILKYDLLELHEGAFFLSHWPNYIVKSSYENITKKKKIPRSFFYEPAPPCGHSSPLDWEFNRNEMGRDFLKIYSAMREAMATGELVPDRVEDLGATVYGKWKKRDSQFSFDGEWVSYLFTPHKIIWWALRKGFYLPDELQKTLGLYIRRVNINNSILNKVKIKITGQFLRYFFPGERTSFYCEHDWMQEYASVKNDVKDTRRVIRNALNELRIANPNSKQGNRSKEVIENEPYYPEAIKEVIAIDSIGIRRHSIPLLEVAMETASHLLLDKFLKEAIPQKNIDRSKNVLDLFLRDFMKNEVISLYTKEAPSVVLDIIYTFAYWTVSSFFLNSEQ